MGIRAAALSIALGFVCVASNAGQVVVGQVAPLSGIDGAQAKAYGVGMACNSAALW